jgi:hypothetical protein
MGTGHTLLHVYVMNKTIASFTANTGLRNTDTCINRASTEIILGNTLIVLNYKRSTNLGTFEI